MAVISISRSDAANDFDGLMSRAANGHEIFIESNAQVVARLLPGMRIACGYCPNRPGFLNARAATATLDGAFGRDLEDIVSSHREPLNSSARGDEGQASKPSHHEA